MDLNAVRDGIVAAVRPIDGLACYKSAPGTLQPPAVVVHGLKVEYQTANAKGLCTITADLTVVVARVDDARATEALDGYLSSGTGRERSLIDALEADKTLGGAVESLNVDSCAGPFALASGSSSLAAATLSLTLYASRT